MTIIIRKSYDMIFIIMHLISTSNIYLLCIKKNNSYNFISLHLFIQLIYICLYTKRCDILQQLLLYKEGIYRPSGKG